MDLNFQLKPTVVSNPHPLIGDARTYYYEGFREGETLGAYVVRVGVKVPKGTYVVLINGVVAMHDWKQYVLQEGDDIVFRSSAHGGGGGGKVLRIVAMVAVAIVAAYAAPSLAGLAGFAEGSAAFMAAQAGFGAAIMIAGTMLVNALFPPPKPQMGGMTDKEQSPTYGISAGKNQASAYGPMLLVFGKHKVVPFLASKPYTTFVGDDQYLSQAFHLGLQPDLDIETIRIGDTNIEEYQNVEVNRSLHDGKLSLVAGNVDLLDGFELGKDMGWISRTTPLDTKHISVDIAANLHDIADDGGERNVAVTIEAQYRKVGEAVWLPMGGYTNTPATKYWSLGYWVTREYTVSGRESEFTRTSRTWQQVRFDGVRPDLHTENQIEVVCHKELRPQGGVFNKTLVEVDVCNTYYWRYIDHPASKRKPWQGSAPDPYSGYAGTGLTKIKGKNPQKPTRHTIDVAVEKGQYEVRFRKVEADISTSRKSNKLTVAQIRCTQTDEADYTGQLRLAVRIKATSQLNGAIDELNVIASAKCPVWTGSSWEVRETSNPAWWFLWWARGKRDTNYRRLYGECLPDNRIDIDAIKSWAEFCDRKGLEFNWVLDRKMTIEEVYYTIARAGRASTTWQTGKRGVIWDSDTLPVTTLLTPANIIAGSFSYKHINADVADEIIVNYFDRNKDWEKAVVRQKVPNTQQTNNPITLDLEGCTSEVQAGREANLLAASQHYHRKQYSFEMDIEGAVLSRGDVAQLTHDLTSYASGGRLVAVNGNVLTLDYDVGVKANAWLSLRSPYNQLFNVRVNANGNKLTLINGWQFGDVGNVEDWLWQYDPVKVAGTKLQIKSVVPQSNGNVKFEAIEYVPDYFLAENNIYKASPAKTAKDLPAIVVYDANTTERVLNESTGETEVTFNWVTSEMSNANVGVYREDEVLFTGRVHGYSVSVNAREGDTLDLEIIPFMQGRTSRTFRKSFEVIGTNIAVPTPTNLQVIGEFTKTSVRIKWDRVVTATGYDVQVLSNGAVRRTVRVGNVLTYSYNLADMQQDGGLVRSLTFKVRALGQRTSKSDWVEVSASNPQIGALQGIQVSGGVRSIIVTCNKPTEEDFDGYLWWVSDNESFTPTLSNVYLDGDFNQLFVELYNNQPLETKDYYVWCAGYDTFGKDSLNISGSFTVRPLVLKLDPQSIAEEMIADGALSINKFAESIRPIQVVNALPSANTSRKGDQAFLTSNNKTYRFDGVNWIATVDGADVNSLPTNKLTGMVNLNQIPQIPVNQLTGVLPLDRLPDVPTTKLSGQVTANQIQANAIGANHIASNVITASHIAANSVTATHIQAGSIGANELSANAVTAGKIAAGAVGADQIQANSITTDKMVIRGANLIPNSDFSTGDYTGWRVWVSTNSASLVGNKILSQSAATHSYYSSAPTRHFATFYFPPKGYDGGWSYSSTTHQATFAHTKVHLDEGAMSDGIAVKSGESYYLSVDMTRLGVTHNGTFAIQTYFYRADGSVLTYHAAINVPASTQINGWTTYEGKITVPNDAARMNVYVVTAVSAGATHSTWIQYFWTNLRCIRMMDSSLVVDGSIKTQHMIANTISGNVIAANTLHGNRIITNTLHANAISAGTIDASHIASRSITADKLVANTITASSAVIANGAIQTAHIANLSVDTLKIKDNAVTNYEIASFSKAETSSKGGTRELFSLTLPNSGVNSLCLFVVEDLRIARASELRPGSHSLIKFTLDGTEIYSTTAYQLSSLGKVQIFKSKVISSSSTLKCIYTARNLSYDDYFTLAFDASAILFKK